MFPVWVLKAPPLVAQAVAEVADRPSRVLREDPCTAAVEASCTLAFEGSHSRWMVEEGSNSLEVVGKQHSNAID